MSALRWLAGVLLALRGGARRRRAEAQRLARSARELERAEGLNEAARQATARGDRGRLPALAEELEKSHAQVRRRRAEPPPTVERSAGGTPVVAGIVLIALAAAALAAIAFAVLYVVVPDTQLLGLSAGVAAAALAVAAAVAGKRLVPRETVVSEYHWFGDGEAQEDVAEIVAEAGEGVSRRRLLLGAAGAAGLTAAGAAAVPLASLGPGVDARLATTGWTRGRRVVTEEGVPIRLQDVQGSALVLGFPEGGDPRRSLGDSINLLRFEIGQLDLPPERKAKCPGGVVAYSRICTHAACAVSMYRAPLFADTEPSPALVCPCHYSTFDPRRGAAVVFGPAGRPLPQLPLRVNAAGELEADGGFYAPPGPSYGTVRLERGRDG